MVTNTLTKTNLTQRSYTMKERVKIGYIGLGRRGSYVLENNISQMEDVDIIAICDLSERKMELACEIITKAGKPEPIMTTDYREVIDNPEIDAIFIMTGWDGRPEMAMESMRAGKYTAIEVGCADNIQICYDLVKTYEETGVPVMMLENCCYGRRELMVLNLVKQGLLGEIVHCTGGYLHYLNEVELFKVIKEKDEENYPHYRLAHYRDENRENYPTHELGPIAKVLNINRGNRFTSLASFGSKSVGLKAFAKRHFGEDSPHANCEYKQNDIVTTMINCAGGETVSIVLDTTIPRAYYSRNFSVRGTLGMTDEARKVVFFEGMEEEIANNEEEMYKKYDHPIHREYIEKGVKEGHGGLDWLVCRAFIESVKAGINTPIDAYDTATWLAVGPLSEMSLANGNAVVEFPDFTNGKWENREPAPKCKYSLEDIVVDESISVV